MSRKRKFTGDKLEEDEPVVKMHRPELRRLYKFICNPFVQEGGGAQFSKDGYRSLRSRMPHLPEEELRRVWIHSESRSVQDWTHLLWV